VDAFLDMIGDVYEVVAFTASLAKYADPVLDLLDPKRHCKHRLFRDVCTFYRGSYIKNLSLLSRPIEATIIVDNSPPSYAFHPRNAIDVTSYVGGDDSDTELLTIGAFLLRIKDVSSSRLARHPVAALLTPPQVPDVRPHLQHWRQGAAYDPNSNAERAR